MARHHRAGRATFSPISYDCRDDTPFFGFFPGLIGSLFKPNPSRASHVTFTYLRDVEVFGDVILPVRHGKVPKEVCHDRSPCVKASNHQRTGPRGSRKEVSNGSDKVAMLRRHPETVRRNDFGVTTTLLLCKFVCDQAPRMGIYRDLRTGASSLDKIEVRFNIGLDCTNSQSGRGWMIGDADLRGGRIDGND